MIGEYIEGKGWEVLCDNLHLFVGYVQGSDTLNARTARPNDKDYEIYCQEIFHIDKVGDYIILNGNEKHPTNSIIDYAEKDIDKVQIELDYELYDCYLTNTYLNGEFPQSLDDLYSEYIYLIGQ